MNTSNNQGKVILNGQGSGGITGADIERRARELASIDGRSGHPTAEDREKAIAELTGENVKPTLNDNGQSAGAVTRDPSETPVFYENQKNTAENIDEQEAVERLALEGVEEAQHEQMVAARNKTRRGH